LGVEYVGICNFVFGTINYFLLFATMGISILGVREIANCKNDIIKLNQVFSSLLFLNVISSVVVLLIYLISITLIPQFYAYRNLLWIGSLQILLTTFLIEWFYKGIENFRYILVRNIGVKVVYVLLLFILVKNNDDYILYFILTIISLIVNVFFNWFYKNKYVHITTKGIITTMKKLISPFFILGLYTILAAMYTSFNVIYLGFACDPIEVGYYVTATKLFGIVLSFFTAFTSVIMPQISNLLNTNDWNSINKINYKSFEILYPLSIFIVLYCEMFTPEIVLLIAGHGYEGAIIPMRLVIPIILVFSSEQIINSHVLVPMRNEKGILMGALTGAIIGILLNIFLVGKYKSSGSSIVWLVSTFCAFLSSYYFSYKMIGNIIPYRLFIRNLFYFVPLVIIYIIISQFSFKYYTILFVAGFIGIVYILAVQCFLLKNKTFIQALPYPIRHLLTSRH
jgi:O-antigen/teichoic acid export membrane protein